MRVRKPPLKRKDYDRDRQALELRKAGATYDQIALQLGYSQRSGAHHAVQRGLSDFMQPVADDVRALELARLDTLLMGLWNAARNGNIGAVDRAIKIMERRSAYLGLDAPKRSEISGPDGEPIQVDQVNTIVLSDDERAERVASLLQRARTRALGPAVESEPHLAPEHGSTNGSVAH